MSLCILAGSKAVTLAVAAFTLSWTHSVEKIEWREKWQVSPAGLELTEARIKGSGAGMEAGEGAVLEGGWWVWQPILPPQRQISLAASGATAAPWRICAEGECFDLGELPGDAVTLKYCD